ncbi:MAG: DivIVA domain-containing protein [Mycoplasmoidaceae bacterium]
MIDKIAQIKKIIRDKKFIKKKYAGYEPIEVDKFLDKISEILETIDVNYQNINNENEIRKKKIDELNYSLLNEKEKNNALSNRIELLLKDGYQSHNLHKEIEIIKKKLNEK